MPDQPHFTRLEQNIVRLLRHHRLLHLPLPLTSATPLLARGLALKTGKPVVLVAPDAATAAFWFHDARAAGCRRAFRFPASFRHINRPDDTDPEALNERWQTVDALQSDGPAVVVTRPEAFLERTVDPAFAARRRFTLRKGEQTDPEFLNEWLFDMDFERTDLVIQPGEFALRGGIIDLFPYNAAEPYRIEFDDNRILRIRPFDPESQLTRRREVHEIAVGAPPPETYPLTEFYRTLPPGSLIYFQSHRDTEAAASTLPAEHGERFLTAFRTEDLLRDYFVLTAAHVHAPTVPVHIKPLPPFGGRFERFVSFVRERDEAFTPFVSAREAAQKRRLSQLLGEAGLPHKWLDYDLWKGFVHEGENYGVFPEHQIFERPFRPPVKKQRQIKQRQILRELNDWLPGDYVVHADHGIGIYEGLVKIERNGRREEAVKLRYRNDDLVYVSIHSLHKLSKYRSKDGKPPVIHRLGSTAWRRTKERTKKRLKKLAFDLLRLYAERKNQKGTAYGADTPMQWQLESSFIYEETPDQAQAIADVKRDMESERPMDRLVCGDVGFGKTEVAVRAAFKAVDNGKQVAVLVPTTILAFQHYNTFRKRLKDFPVTIDYLNRFRTTAERRRILQDLAQGRIDIIIGTHALVSDKVKFKDLGLLIIDEEQKFGVNIKEKIKNLKKNIDVLTLTATPIPRTLQFSLMGERDLSVINTPPPNRMPIHTVVHRFDRALIRQAIEREMARGGQVYFVHNRVQDIEAVAQLLKTDFPDLRIAVGHGRTDGKQLEKIMLDFMKGRYDILVSTSIVENGLDVPNANTMIVNNAHMFGLADLHQLRGRVGRSDKQAYCYFLIPSYETLTEEARKRMQVLENYTALGSGFEIAMHDLEIRGAGDLLGAEQSGFINDLGFDLYQKILAEAVDEVRREEFADTENRRFQGLDPASVQIQTDKEWHIPNDYINSVRERMYFYQRLSSVKDADELEKVSDEMRDRFGPLPPQTEGLARLIRIKLAAARLGWEKLTWKKDILKAYPTSRPEYVDSPVWMRIMEYAYERPETFRIRPDGQGGFVLHMKAPSGTGTLELIHRLVEYAAEGDN